MVETSITNLRMAVIKMEETSLTLMVLRCIKPIFPSVNSGSIYQQMSKVIVNGFGSGTSNVQRIRNHLAGSSLNRFNLL